MKPMEWAKPWWPADLGDPASSGAQNDMRYAFFPKPRRLLVDRNGTRTTYDSAGHQIQGVAQQQSASQSLTFTSQDGPVDLDSLEQVD